MAFVVTEGALRSLSRPELPPATTLRLTDDFTQDYAEIWRTQPAVRTVVSFLARNIASLGLHAFRRISDTDRERLSDHPLTALIARPNPATTRYRLFNALVHDLGIYDTAYWLKVRDRQQGTALWRLPPSMVTPKGDNWMYVDRFEVRGGRGRTEFNAEQVVHFHGFNPDDPRTGASPIEALRRVLAEEYEAGRMREQVLRNGARVSGYIERPAGMGWSDVAKQRFRAEWHGQYTGSGPQTGGTPILEDGMTFKQASQTAEQLQYIEARKLTREEVASAFFIPPPMVGILDQATFSNITQQHKMLYQDTLGPWLTMIQEEMGLQLLPDVAERDVYVEFNLAEKLRGSFEEQAQAASTATGRPWMTANEQRARFNLPALDGGDDLVVPLNVLVGGQASPRDADPEPGEASMPVATKHLLAKYVQVLENFFTRQHNAARSKLGAGEDDWWDGDRWDRELTADLWRLDVQTASTAAGQVLAALGMPEQAYDDTMMLGRLADAAEQTAKATNAATKGALAAGDPVPSSERVAALARACLSAATATGTADAAQQCGTTRTPAEPAVG